jgi:hypothetical protein
MLTRSGQIAIGAVPEPWCGNVLTPARAVISGYVLEVAAGIACSGGGFSEEQGMPAITDVALPVL